MTEEKAIVAEGRECGDDTPPVFASVRDESYCRGCMTSQSRTASPQYVEFLKRHKEVKDG
jgi:hypothetical protein